MKKILALLMASVLVLALAACGSGTTEPAETEETETTEAAETETEEPAEGTEAEVSSGVEDGVLTVAMECNYAPYNWSQPDDSNGAVPIKDSSDYANGYDVNYCVGGEGMREMAVVTDKETGRRMRVYSDQPGIQFYSGQGLHFTGHQGVVYGPYGGLALETQHYADSPNHPHFPSTTLKAGETFRTVTKYSFETI